MHQLHESCKLSYFNIKYVALWIMAVYIIVGNELSKNNFSHLPISLGYSHHLSHVHQHRSSSNWRHQDTQSEGSPGIQCDLCKLQPLVNLLPEGLFTMQGVAGRFPGVVRKVDIPRWL